jgi:inositol monophosphatase family protein
MLRSCVAMAVVASIYDYLSLAVDVGVLVGTKKKSGYDTKCLYFSKKLIILKTFFFSLYVCFVLQDHASGSLLVEEAGGIVTDYRGRPLDFGLGRTLGTNYGVVAARKEVHAQVIKAVQEVLAEKEDATQEGEAVEKSKSSVRFFSPGIRVCLTQSEIGGVFFFDSTRSFS